MKKAYFNDGLVVFIKTKVSNDFALAREKDDKNVSLNENK
jgi:hypothetical protein